MARPVSRVPPRTSAPARIRTSHSSPRIRLAYRSTKLKSALGDTSLPKGPLSGGSLATPSIVPAVFQAADNAIASLLSIATTTPGTPFEKRKSPDLTFKGGRVFVKADGPAGGVPFADLLKHANQRLVTGSGNSEATFGNPKPKFSTHSFGCHFVEVLGSRRSPGCESAEW